MVKTLHIIMDGKARGWARSRTNGKRHFDAPQNVEQKALIRLLAHNKAEEEGIKLPLPAGKKGYVFDISVYVKPPKSITKKRLREILEGEEKCLVKPDLDNVVKLWLDALVSGGVIEDDKNVRALHAAKAYTDKESSDFVSCKISWEEQNG